LNLAARLRGRLLRLHPLDAWPGRGFRPGRRPRRGGLLLHPRLSGLLLHAWLDGLRLRPRLDWLLLHARLDGLRLRPGLDDRRLRPGRRLLLLLLPPPRIILPGLRQKNRLLIAGRCRFGGRGRGQQERSSHNQRSGQKELTCHDRLLACRRHQ
jgi:hypothetical protein